jgi:3-phenylpropionate/cinnamic acid dioxygenase small subunit
MGAPDIAANRARLTDRTSVEAFLIHEVELLDDRQFEAWRDLFTDDGYYWVPLRPGQTSPDTEASLFYDDKRIMQTRFERLRHPKIHSQTPPHRTCHVIGNLRIDEVDEARGECTAHTKMVMTDYRVGVQRVFAGKVRHRLVLDDQGEGGGFRIRWKRVDLVNSDDVHELIAVPF